MIFELRLMLINELIITTVREDCFTENVNFVKI